MATAKELRKIQKELCDEFIKDPQKIDRIMNNFKQTLKGFHNYSLGNLVLANWQHYEKTNDTIEVLASYNTWKKKGRYVKKGEKSLKVLAPRRYQEKDDEGNVIDEHLYFVRVPVFDLSQTAGERLEKDYTTNNLNIGFNEITALINNIPINLTNKELTRGSTNGKEINISRHISDTEKICVLFHELGHYKLHFGKDRRKYDKPTKELEAETISYIISSYLGIKNDESSSYIKHWYNENPEVEINGLGDKLIKTAQKIIQEYHLDDYLQTKIKSSTDTQLEAVV